MFLGCSLQVLQIPTEQEPAIHLYSHVIVMSCRLVLQYIEYRAFIGKVIIIQIIFFFLWILKVHHLN
jgi:hypothetical protein